jgi:MFS-type transporter involved in bile tolerance (Atg22 family)
MGWGSNKVLLFGIVLALLMIVGLVYIPFLANAFDNQKFPVIFWPILAFFALILYSLEWIRKAFVRRKERTDTGQLSNSR